MFGLLIAKLHKNNLHVYFVLFIFLSTAHGATQENVTPEQDDIYTLLYERRPTTPLLFQLDSTIWDDQQQPEDEAQIANRKALISALFLKHPLFKHALLHPTDNLTGDKSGYCLCNTYEALEAILKEANDADVVLFDFDGVLSNTYSAKAHLETDPRIGTLFAQLVEMMKRAFILSSGTVFNQNLEWCNRCITGSPIEVDYMIAENPLFDGTKYLADFGCQPIKIIRNTYSKHVKNNVKDEYTHYFGNNVIPYLTDLFWSQIAIYYSMEARESNQTVEALLESWFPEYHEEAKQTLYDAEFRELVAQRPCLAVYPKQGAFRAGSLIALNYRRKDQISDAEICHLLFHSQNMDQQSENEILKKYYQYRIFDNTITKWIHKEEELIQQLKDENRPFDELTQAQKERRERLINNHLTPTQIDSLKSYYAHSHIKGQMLRSVLQIIMESQRRINGINNLYFVDDQSEICQSFLQHALELKKIGIITGNIKVVCWTG